MQSFVLSSSAIWVKVSGPRKFPSSYSLSKNSLPINLSAISMPSTSVSFLRHMVNPFNEELFCTLEMRTLIWAGLRSIPEMVNSRFVLLVFRSLIICPNLPKFPIKTTCQRIGLILLFSPASLLFFSTLQFEPFFILSHPHKRSILFFLVFFLLAGLFLLRSLLKIFEGLQPTHFKHSVSVGLDDVVDFFGPCSLAQVHIWNLIILEIRKKGVRYIRTEFMLNKKDDKCAKWGKIWIR